MGERSFDKTTASLNKFAPYSPSILAMSIWQAARHIRLQKGRQCNNWFDDSIVTCRTIVAVKLAFEGLLMQSISEDYCTHTIICAA